MFLKLEKCDFERSEIDYLGLRISEGTVTMDEEKRRSVLEWPAPTKVKELQSFLGFAQSYSRVRVSVGTRADIRQAPAWVPALARHPYP